KGLNTLHPECFNNSISEISNLRKEDKEHVWSQNMDGISFVFTKGPAGQTPFPTLVAMSSYFPQDQPLPQSSQQRQQQQQQQPQQ
ncbi:hypothetical protein BX616_008278, partial [Lobosporangium transversale]